MNSITAMMNDAFAGKPVRYAFQEEKHPRDEDGKFGTGGSSQSEPEAEGVTTRHTATAQIRNKPRDMTQKDFADAYSKYMNDPETPKRNKDEGAADYLVLMTSLPIHREYMGIQYQVTKEDTDNGEKYFVWQQLNNNEWVSGHRKEGFDADMLMAETLRNPDLQRITKDFYDYRLDEYKKRQTAPKQHSLVDAMNDAFAGRTVREDPEWSFYDTPASEVQEWSEAGFISFAEAERWASEGFKPIDAGQWKLAGVGMDDAYAARDCLASIETYLGVKGVAAKRTAYEWRKANDDAGFIEESLKAGVRNPKDAADWAGLADAWTDGENGSPLALTALIETGVSARKAWKLFDGGLDYDEAIAAAQGRPTQYSLATMTRAMNRAMRPIRYRDARKGTPAKDSSEGRWITIGGKPDSKKGTKHSGGFPIRISSDGTILESRVAGLQGKNVSQVQEHFSRERRGKTRGTRERAPKDRDRRLRRQSRVSEAVFDTAEKWEIDADALFAVANDVLNARSDDFRQQELTKKNLRDRSGLSMQDIARIENTGKDYTSRIGGTIGQRLRHFDAVSQEVAREFPGILGDASDEASDFSRNAWDLMRQGKRRPPQLHDESILGEAAQIVDQFADWKPKTTDVGGWEEEKPVPFRRDGNPKRYQESQKPMTDTQRMTATMNELFGAPVRYTKKGMLFDKEESGEWKTVNGTHVYIENGEITKGPDALTSKKPDAKKKSLPEKPKEKKAEFKPTHKHFGMRVMLVGEDKKGNVILRNKRGDETRTEKENFMSAAVPYDTDAEEKKEQDKKEKKTTMGELKESLRSKGIRWSTFVEGDKLSISGTKYGDENVDLLRKAGARWDRNAKNWVMSYEKIQKLKDEISSLPEAEAPKPSKPTPKQELDPMKGERRLSGGSGYGHSGWTEGSTIRNSDDRIEKGEPEWLYVMGAKKKHFREEGMSFGVGDDSGYVYSATTREATPEEAKPAIDKHEKKSRTKKATADLKSMSQKIQTSGEYPESKSGINVEGERLLDSFNTYGGGNAFVIGDEHIWYLENNGTDGGDWSRNNVRTGGAGAIGHRIPKTPELEAELRKLNAELSPDTPKRNGPATKVVRMDSGWTPETTVSRRAEWNEMVKAGKFTGSDGKVDWSLMKEQEEKQRWSLKGLKAATKYPSDEPKKHSRPGRPMRYSERLQQQMIDRMNLQFRHKK